MQINIEILGCAKVEEAEKCTALNEKTIVSDMMLRRRLTRNARISLYLADQLGDMSSPIVIGNAYGEVAETFDILKAIVSKETVSPTAFQNSVHNTPASYLSIVGQNKGYVTTVSDLHDTSMAVLKVGALKSLKFDFMVLIVTDSIEFERVDELNRCGITQKESGVALKICRSTQEPNVVLKGKKFIGYSPSVWSMLEIEELCQEKEKVILGIEI